MSTTAEWMDRDQRTVSSWGHCECCGRRCCRTPTAAASSSSCSSSSRASPAASRRLLARAVHRLGEVLLVGACLLSVVHVPQVMSAPLDRQKPLWIDPCGLRDTEYPAGESELTEFVPRSKDEVLLTQIVMQTRTALSHAKNFRDKYVEETFKQKLEDHHTAWRGNQYDWLPSSQEIPKTLGESLDPDFLKTLQLDQTLMDTYEYLQKFAVGLEQITYDQNENNGQFFERFKETEYNVRATLCEIELAMLEKNVTKKPDVTRAIMSDEYRSMGNSSYRNLRDWVIFRDYMNGLEYVLQVFEYFGDHLAS